MTSLLILWARYPFPPQSGRTKLLAQRLAFCAGANCTVHLVIFDTASEEEQKRRKTFLQEQFPFVQSVRFLPLPSLPHAAWNMLRYSLLSDAKTLQESLFFSPAYKRLIDEEIHRLQPTTIYCDTFRMAQYLEDFQQSATLRNLPHKPHIVFDWDDIFSQKYQNYLERTDDDTPLLGYLSKYVPAFIQKLANHVLRRTLLKIEIARSLQRETVLPPHADETILVSPREVETLQKRSNTASVSAMLPAVHFPTLPENCPERPQSLVFMGLLNFMPNEEGLLHFLEVIFPLVQKKLAQNKVSRASLTIIGANPTPRLLAAAEKHGELVKFTGFVPEPASILCSSEVFIAPVYYGTGIKTKILDGMAYHVPVVTTPQGAEGLALRSGEEAIIAKSDEEFAEACTRLILNPAERSHIRAQALRYVQTHHTEEALRTRFLSICRISS
ncbi:MAG: glycosyltransferase family 4 protein [Candidatus Kapabacteria bacterium]|jgi:glycosyltransferase involved in cell wall biosynthesis|nr:glycosyltransferase family 4 protein [Candidatus Kapabacteria bacterium]